MNDLGKLKVIDLNTSKSLSGPEQASLIDPSSGRPSTPDLTNGSALSDSPLILIDAKDTGSTLDLSEIWAYRDLLYFLTWRDIKIRYKQTLLGATWAIIQPLFAMLLFTLLFGKLAKIPSDNIPYPLFAYAGLLPWTFFANAVTNSGNSLVGSTSLITKVYFPRMIIPAAAVVAGLVDFFIALLLLIPLLIYYQIQPRLNLLLLPLFCLLTTLLALGVGMLLSALNVRFRDVRYALPFLIQLWLFASPVIYPSSMIPEKWKWILSLNPMTGTIEGFRASLFGKDFEWQSIIVSAVLTMFLLVGAAYVFKRVEDTFADIV